MNATGRRFEALYHAAHANGLRGIDAWETGRADTAALVSEHPDAGAWRHWWDFELGSPLQLALSWQHGTGVRWIRTGPLGDVDHLLPECPAVRRCRAHAGYGLGLVDPGDPELCGWCRRVFRAKAPADETQA